MRHYTTTGQHRNEDFNSCRSFPRVVFSASCGVPNFLREKPIKMQIFVLSGQTNTLDVNPAISVADLKQTLASETGVSAESQILTLGGQPLVDGLSLAENGVQALSTISLSVGLLGGNLMEIDFILFLFLNSHLFSEYCNAG